MIFKQFLMLSAVAYALIMSFPLTAQDTTALAKTIQSDQTEKPINAVLADKQALFVAPECNSLSSESYEEKKECANRYLIQAISDNFRYPEEAYKLEKQGMAVISFIVEKDGELTNLKIGRDPGFGMGEEALRIMKTVAAMGPWEPAKYKGLTVRVGMNIPLNFKLQ